MSLLWLTVYLKCAIYGMYLYCISDGSLCKFGYSVDPTRRLKSLQTGSSSQLSLVHSVLIEGDLCVKQLERTFHREYAHRRARGEWFRCTCEEGRSWLTWFEIHYVN
jgi:hypothetical protein